jgi:hypothetical protein
MTVTTVAFSAPALQASMIAWSVVPSWDASTAILMVISRLISTTRHSQR